MYLYFQIYSLDDAECSELCSCGESLTLTCHALCVPFAPCRTALAFYSHASPAYQAFRGRCLCYSGRFICMKPPLGDYILPGWYPALLYPSGDPIPIPSFAFDASSLPLCLHICMYTNFIATSCMQSLFRCCFPLSTLRLSAATGNDGAELSRMLHFPARQEMLLAVSLSLPLPSPKQKTDSILKELFIGGKSYSWPVAHSSWPDAILMYATFHLPPTVLCRCHKGCPRLRGGSLPALTCVLSVLCCARCTADSQWRVNHI